MLTVTVQGVFESFKRRLDGQSQRWRKVLSCSSKEITGGGIAFRRLHSRPRRENEPSSSPGLLVFPSRLRWQTGASDARIGYLLRRARQYLSPSLALSVKPSLEALQHTLHRCSRHMSRTASSNCRQGVTRMIIDRYLIKMIPSSQPNIELLYLVDRTLPRVK